MIEADIEAQVIGNCAEIIFPNIELAFFESYQNVFKGEPGNLHLR